MCVCCVLIQSERHNGSVYGLINIALRAFRFFMQIAAHNKNERREWAGGARHFSPRTYINILLCALQVFQLFLL